MLNSHVIIGVHVSNRVEKSQSVQQVFSEFGCNIKTRLGLHDVDESYCSPNGLMLIEFIGTKDELKRMTEKLSAIEAVEVKTMIFEHP